MNTYRDFKNHLHNTLAVTKDDIRGMVQMAVDKIVERKIEVMFRDRFTIDRIIDQAVRGRINLYWGESEDKLDDYIKKQVVRGLLDGVKLRVEIARTKKDATPAPETIQIRRRKTK